MIVVAVHDDIECMSNILSDLAECDLCGHAVLVLDTNSSSLDFRAQFLAQSSKYTQFQFQRLSKDCWDSGAYIHAYLHYSADKYIFLQDSLRILNKNSFNVIDERLNYTDVLGLFNFFYCYDSPEQQQWVEDGIPACGFPSYGIFGPIFSATRFALDRIPKEWLKHPINKMQGNGMERRWPLMFHALNIPVDFLAKFDSHDMWRQHEATGYRTDFCTQYFQKIFKYRP